MRASGPGRIAGPVFVEHWANGDLLIPTHRHRRCFRRKHTRPPAGAGGMTLLDVKAVISVRNPDKVGWLWQLFA
jgi:hypothetical protein